MVPPGRSVKIIARKVYENGVTVYHVLIPSASSEEDHSVVLVVKDGVLVKASCDCPFFSIRCGLCSHIRIACVRLGVRIPKEFYIYGRILCRKHGNRKG